MNSLKHFGEVSVSFSTEHISDSSSWPYITQGWEQPFPYYVFLQTPQPSLPINRTKYPNKQERENL